MDSQDLLSIITTISNQATRITPFLKKLEAVLNGSHSSYEIILVNNGSLDETEKICRYLANLYIERVRFIHLATRQKRGKVLNLALKAARGEFMAFISLESSPDILSTLISKSDVNRLVEYKSSSSNLFFGLWRSSIPDIIIFHRKWLLDGGLLATEGSFYRQLKKRIPQIGSY